MNKIFPIITAIILSISFVYGTEFSDTDEVILDTSEEFIQDVTIEESRFESDSEAALFNAAKGLEMTNDMQDNYNQLEALTPVITEFFDNNMVFAEDQTVQNNRLAILSMIAQAILTLADTSRINTK